MKKEIEITYNNVVYPLVLDLYAIEQIEEEIDGSFLSSIADMKDPKNLKLSIIKTILFQTAARGCQITETDMFPKEETLTVLKEIGFLTFIKEMIPPLVTEVFSNDLVAIDEEEVRGKPNRRDRRKIARKK